MVERSHCRLVIVGDGVDPSALGDVRVIRISDAFVTAQQRRLPFETAGVANPPAYVTFTSGTTGQPKAVLAPTSQVDNRFQWMWRRYPFLPGEVCCQRMPLSYVDSIWEILGPVCAGTPVALIPSRDYPNGQKLLDALAMHRVSRVWMLPASINALVEAFPNLGARLPLLRFWVTTGDAIAPGVVRKFFDAVPEARLFNLYGTSEVWDATWHDIPPNAEFMAHVPVGTPINGVEVAVVDERGNELPPGATGEIAIGGCGLASGYIDSAPGVCRDFRSTISGSSGTRRFYRTGDYGFIDAAGAVVYQGRRSSWVHRGKHQVNLLAIEAALSLHPAIVEDAVAAFETSTGKIEVVGFYLSRTGQAHSDAELRAFLSSRLGSQDLPDRLLLVNSFPMTPSGKINRRLLQVPR
jgi:acyl-coenzyme A synthetase/AMP-(fatty) acid ligase